MKDLFNLQQEAQEYIRKCDDQTLGGLQKIFEQIEEHAHMGEEFYLVLNGILTPTLL